MKRVVGVLSHQRVLHWLYILTRNDYHAIYVDNSYRCSSSLQPRDIASDEVRLESALIITTILGGSLRLCPTSSHWHHPKGRLLLHHYRHSSRRGRRRRRPVALLSMHLFEPPPVEGLRAMLNAKDHDGHGTSAFTPGIVQSSGIIFSNYVTRFDKMLRM